jgi:hypothetical protein
MNVKGLAALAGFLFALCCGAAILLASRLGWWATAEQVEWTFVNPTLGVARGQRVILRPIVEGVRSFRYTFLLAVAEPMTDDPVAPVPHLRAGVEELEGDEWLYRPPVEALAFCQLGALTPQEWLEEIRPVMEVGGAFGDRMLLKAIFGHRNGSIVFYFHDPERPVPAVGWTRSEMVVQERPPEIHFATDGGLAELGAPPRDESASDGK